MRKKDDTFFVGVNVIVVRENKLLLGKRKNVFGDGTWGLPGGHLEHGEKMEDAARRELQEETGLQAKSFEFVNLVNDPRWDAHYLQVGFIAHDVTGEPSVREADRCAEWSWFDLHKLPENIFIAHIKQIDLFRTQSDIFSDPVV